MRALGLTGLIVVALIAMIGCGDGGDETDTVVGDDAVIDDVGGEQDSVTTDPDTSDDVIGDDVFLDNGTEVVEEPGVVRFIHVSDLHYSGLPEAKNLEYIQTRVEDVNASETEPDLIVLTGDLLDYIPLELNDPEIEGRIHWVRDGLDALSAPWMTTIGNHEFYDFFEPVTMTEDGEARREAFYAVMGTDNYFATTVNGVRIIALDSMEDDSWGENAGLMGRFSSEQLDWLRSQLADGVPSLLFFHHPPNTLAPKDGQPTLCEVLTENPGVVKGLFTGHLHGFWRGDYCGVPYYVNTNWRQGADQWFEVEYDGPNDTLTILNEDRVPFPKPPEFECEPSVGAVGDPSLAVGSLMALKIENTHVDAQGLAQYVGEALGDIPMVVSVDGYDSVNGVLSARLTIASRWVEPDGFWAYIDGAPCVPFDIHLENPCGEAGPVTFRTDLIPFLSGISDDPIDPEWSLRVDIVNFQIAGRLGVTANPDGIPTIEEGTVMATLQRDVALTDLMGILVHDYCAEKIEGCVPGASDTMPACDDLSVADLYDLIPWECEVYVEGLGVRSLLDMLATVPETVGVTGELKTEVVEASSTDMAGYVDDELFSTEAGRNCEGVASRR